MYEYYEKVQSPNHYYFAEEIFEALGYVLPNGIKPKDIHYIIRNYLKNNDISIRVLYHQTSKGLKRVYPFEIAFDAITEYVSSINNKIKEGKRHES